MSTPQTQDIDATDFHAIVLELDKLKSVYRKSYVTAEQRYENSAEHSWHLATMLMAVSNYFPSKFNLAHAVKIALTHDICEIGAGDVCTYHVDANRSSDEAQYLSSLQQSFPRFGDEVRELWQEYEDQRSLEAKWVKTIDKLLPFILNLEAHGKTWQEQGISPEMVINHHKFIDEISPSLYAWMLEKIKDASENGWFTTSEALS